MAPILFAALLIVPIAELWVIVQVAERLGVLSALGLLLLVSVAGAWLLKQQGVATWRRLRETLRRGQVPTDEVADGALILMGGALLLTPGFISDVLGLLLVIPVTRALFKRAGRRWIARRAGRRLGMAPRRARVYSATVTRTKGPDDVAGTPPIPPPRAPEAPPRDADGSPGKG